MNLLPINLGIGKLAQICRLCKILGFIIELKVHLKSQRVKRCFVSILSFTEGRGCHYQRAPTSYIHVFPLVETI